MGARLSVGQIPSAALSSLALAIEALEGTKAPLKLNQRRTFIEDWFAINGGNRAACAGGGGGAAAALGSSFGSLERSGQIERAQLLGGGGGGGGGGALRWLEVSDPHHSWLKVAHQPSPPGASEGSRRCDAP